MDFATGKKGEEHALSMHADGGDVATIKDVAKRAGVAPETVSRVINNRGYISDQTRSKVYCAMDELGYHPREYCCGSLGENMGMIALVIPNMQHPYFSRVADCLEKQAKERGYKLLLCAPRGHEEDAKQVAELCQSRFVKGMILFSPDLFSRELQKYRRPVVASEKMEGGGNGTGSVSCDNRAGGRLAADHLISLGCENLILIGMERDCNLTLSSREEGFFETCQSKGKTCRVYKTSYCSFNAMDYQEEIRKILEENPSCDGIFATSDLIAAQVVFECARIGRNIPDDIRLIGFDDTVMAQVLSITTISQPVEEMMNAALDIIEKWEDGQQKKNLIFPVTLIERESTRI